MSENSPWKLVRDGYAKVPNDVYEMRTAADTAEFHEHLRHKPVEEAEELEEAIKNRDTAQITEELADLREAVDAVALEFGIPPGAIERVMQEKGKLFGRFSAGILSRKKVKDGDVSAIG